MVVYNFGQVQRTSQVERKTKCSKTTTAGYSRPLDCLVNLGEKRKFMYVLFYDNRYYNLFVFPPFSSGIVEHAVPNHKSCLT